MKAGQSQLERLSDYPNLPKHESICFRITIGQGCGNRIYFDVYRHRLSFMAKVFIHSTKGAHLVDSCFVWHKLTCYWPSCFTGPQSKFMYA
ncbi:hypothetical protein WJX79_005906 [Trebouxia sp. C0005]